jgi:hypothetical protein
MLNKRSIFLFLSLILSFSVLAQNNAGDFGKITYRDLNFTRGDVDSAASAIVLREFGEAYIDNNNDHNLIFEYHVVIKILTPEGLKYGNVEIPLWKRDTREERIISIEAASYGIRNGSMVETKLNPKEIYSDNYSKRYNEKKFAIPNLQVGSVIYYHYKLESPFFYNFRSWEFQSEIPKVSSEYWAKIPGNYIYHMALKGYQQLDKNESEVVKDCFTPGGGQKADCALYKWKMLNIPAFVEEDFMTAKSNFLSSINFELQEVKKFNGTKDKIAKEWKDVDLELRHSDRFGKQLKRGKDIVSDQLQGIVDREPDLLKRAQQVYSFIQQWYDWNGYYGIFSDLGIKKAFSERKGNVGDINLTLIAALQWAGLSAEPLILSTRSNGVVTDLFPVISEFNYVVAKLSIDGKDYLLDAVDNILPFGVISERCLNGRGRVLEEKKSYWYDIVPSVRLKKYISVNLNLQPDGVFEGKIDLNFFRLSRYSRTHKIL